MTDSIRRRYERYLPAKLSWHWDTISDSPFLWRDVSVEDVGPNMDARFEAIADRMMKGNYYPPDAIRFYGPWMDEGRDLRQGDRILQRARVGLFLKLWAMTEVQIAEKTDTTCTIGYLTTKRHFGRGKWQSKLTKDKGRLILAVEATTTPGSLLFWIGLPIARALQRRAWRRAAEEFRKL
ncbi:MAG: DUF1990 family protein [Fimbriimonadales bacterium]